MRTLIVYESMYGNTRLIAERIGEAMSGGDVTVVPAREASAAHLEGADLLVVGAPTHVHGLPRPSTRKGAADQAGAELALEPHAAGAGVRELLDGLTPQPGHLAAAFDTRVDIAPLLSGRAGRAIAKMLRGHGYRLVTEPESFLVDRQTRLVEGEADRARAWGAGVLAAAETATAAAARDRRTS